MGPKSGKVIRQFGMGIADDPWTLCAPKLARPGPRHLPRHFPPDLPPNSSSQKLIPRRLRRGSSLDSSTQVWSPVHHWPGRMGSATGMFSTAGAKSRAFPPVFSAVVAVFLGARPVRASNPCVPHGSARNVPVHESSFTYGDVWRSWRRCGFTFGDVKLGDMSPV